MSDVEFLYLGEYDPKQRRRDFDAVSFGGYYWQGYINFEHWGENDDRVTVSSDRRDPFGEDYATKRGTEREVKDADLAKAAIEKAIVSCFDHTTTYEALSDGNGGWIALRTDT